MKVCKIPACGSKSFGVKVWSLKLLSSVRLSTDKSERNRTKSHVRERALLIGRTCLGA